MHIPVLVEETIKYLDPKPGENFIDCTIGGGGHSAAILEKNWPKGKILGIDWDCESINKFKIKNNLTLVCDNYANLKEIVEREKFKNISGILLDLGFSSWHLEESGRGFSFLRKEPLDMRFSQGNQLTAEKIINYRSFGDLEKILREYGEEEFSEKIVKAIVEERKAKPVKNTLDLVEIIKKALPLRYQRQRIHFATRTFQALRIAVNGELENLKKVLPQAIEVLGGGGRLVVISFHSLEDRIVKDFFKDKLAAGAIEILTKKPITPSEEEIRENPKSRSAKLRTARKL